MLLLDPRNTNTSFALVASIGALAGLLAAPLTGALADRTTWHGGRRRLWILSGMMVGIAGLVVMAWSRTIPILLLGEVLEQVGVDAILSNVTALIPDQVLACQQASTSALNGMAPVVGGALGLVLVTTLTNTREVAQGYVLLALCCLLCVGAFLIVLRERPLPPEAVTPFQMSCFLASFWHPFSSRDFVFTLLSRLLVFLAFTLLGSYTFFYFRAVLHASAVAAAHAVTLFQLLSTGVLLVTALLAGSLAQRLGRLKPFVVIGAALMTLGLVLLALFPNWQAVLGAAVIFGCGFGAYVGIDIALAVKVLPRAAESGKDLGVIYTAIFLPLILSPLIGALVLNVTQRFPLLFLLAAGASLLAAVLILPVRSVR
jgi:MFS family permease